MYAPATGADVSLNQRVLRQTSGALRRTEGKMRLPRADDSEKSRRFKRLIRMTQRTDSRASKSIVA
jgi:hypothetical protein